MIVFEIDEEDEDAEVKALDAVEFDDADRDNGMFIIAFEFWVKTARLRIPDGEEDEDRESCCLGDKTVDEV